MHGNLIQDGNSADWRMRQGLTGHMTSNDAVLHYNTSSFLFCALNLEDCQMLSIIIHCILRIRENCIYYVTVMSHIWADVKVCDLHLKTLYAYTPLLEKGSGPSK
ncbi:hypothetical protein GDO81_006127 [Engystomops pustulosus]|uniref:Uncharacterized protein n=1 Tax=Engystomops pustulosus TaxID=76066 RepID=A0AAV7CXW4_ENGPU|nr:hypothetical protein GDO81_006127 [Engystomops pustulosus]